MFSLFRRFKRKQFELPVLLPSFEMDEFLRLWGESTESLLAHDARLARAFITLGELDCGIRHLDRTSKLKYVGYMTDVSVAEEMNRTHEMPAELRKFDDHYSVLCALWILYGYEIVRTFHERCETHQIPCSEISDTKKCFERVRIPLAKHEKPRNWPKDTGGIVTLNWTSAKGFGWGVTPNEVVYRIDLADHLRNALIAMRADGRLALLCAALPPASFID